MLDGNGGKHMAELTAHLAVKKKKKEREGEKKIKIKEKERNGREEEIMGLQSLLGACP